MTGVAGGAIFCFFMWVAGIFASFHMDGKVLGFVFFWSVVFLTPVFFAVWMAYTWRRYARVCRWISTAPPEFSEEPQYLRDSPWPLHKVGWRTPLRSYSVVTSVGIFSVEGESGPFLGRQPVFCFFCCLWTLVFGWWSLPSGPSTTIRSLYSNVRGGALHAFSDPKILERTQCP
ncbi:MAG: hypothetical protein AAGJ79_03545 [Verrucomicrobiota bacterium]